MPYISQSDRELYEEPIAELIQCLTDTGFPAGHLNYIISSILVNMLDCVSYQDYNDMIGVLECAKLELFRRQVAPYEDKKLAENGDLD